MADDDDSLKSKFTNPFRGIRWVPILLGALLTTGMLAAGFETFAWERFAAKGDARWAAEEQTLTRSEIVQVVATAVSKEIESHEKNERYHPSPSGTAAYVRRHEMTSLEDRISRMESNLIAEIRSIRDNRN